MYMLNYIREAYRLMSDREFYMPKNSDPTQQYHLEIQQLVDTMFEKEFISKQVHKALKFDNPRTPKFLPST